MNRDTIKECIEQLKNVLLEAVDDPTEAVLPLGQWRPTCFHDYMDWRVANSQVELSFKGSAWERSEEYYDDKNPYHDSLVKWVVKQLCSRYGVIPMVEKVEVEKAVVEKKVVEVEVIHLGTFKYSTGPSVPYRLANGEVQSEDGDNYRRSGNYYSAASIDHGKLVVWVAKQLQDKFSLKFSIQL